MSDTNRRQRTGPLSPRHSNDLLRNDPSNDTNNNDDDGIDELEREESSLVQIYRKPSYISIIRSCLINLALPFLNGVFLGFGEIFAHEVAFLLGWRGVTLRPAGRMGLGTGTMSGGAGTESGSGRGFMAGPGFGVQSKDPRDSVGSGVGGRGPNEREMRDLTSME